MAIVCPQCGWRFRHQVKWLCDECRTQFYTFDHHGVCPNCGHVHELTLCPNCLVVSVHEQWYRPDDADEPAWWQRLFGKTKAKKKKRGE